MAFADLLEDDGFHTALGIGASAFLAGALVGVVALLVRRNRPRSRSRSRGSVAPVVGLLMAGASVVALNDVYTDPVRGRLLAGLVLLAAGPCIAALVLGRISTAWLLTALAAAPGAFLVARAASDANDFGWTATLVFTSTVVGGALVSDFDRANARAGLGPVLLVITVLGCYATLPDTEEIMIVLGATLPLALLGFPFALGALGPGSYAAIGLLGWVAAVGGAGRRGAMVAAMACLGVMLVEPVVRRLMRSRARTPRRPVSASAMLVVALQCALAATIARIGGLEHSGSRSAAISLLALGAGALVLSILLFRRKRGSRPALAEVDPQPVGEPLR